MKFFLFLLRRDLKTRFAGSSLGAFWFIFQPLLNFCVYATIFGIIFKFDVKFKGRDMDFLPFFLAGFWPWIALQEAIIKSSSILLEYSSIIKKVKFNQEVLVPLAITTPQIYIFLGFTSLITFLILGYNYEFNQFSSSYLLLIPFSAQILWTLALSYVFSIISVYSKDLSAWLPSFLNLWFFATPIFYSADQIPNSFQWLMNLNPLVPILDCYREILFTNNLTTQTIAILLLDMAIAIIVLLFGLFLFKRGKRWLADVL